VPASVPPHAIAITFANEQGIECRVSVWLVTDVGSPPVPPAVQTTPSSRHLAAEAARPVH
jgi:hypothetical protein